MKSIMEIPQKTKRDLSYDPLIPLLGTYLKESKLGHNLRGHFYHSSSPNSQALETAQITYK
jgi:hypothetical protein